MKALLLTLGATLLLAGAASTFRRLIKGGSQYAYQHGQPSVHDPI
jgi:hypothetical protein